MMKSKEFIRKATEIAKNYKTLYVMGCFGAPLTAANKKRYTQNHSYNKAADRTKMINAATEDTFGFDCVCLIKGILWGWSGDKSKTYGGSGYAVNGVPDIGADSMITKCTGVSTSGWASMVPGEAVWCSGHIGIYIGDGLAVECTPKWENQVQITAVGNIGKKSGYNTRTWTKHGKLPYVDYSDQTTASAPSASGKAPATTNTDPKAIWDFLMGKIGNAYGVAGLMGNLYAESGLLPCNLQNSYEKSLGYTDTSYTAAVDNGSYTNFVRDSAGYGLAQWTYWSRKEALKKYADSLNASIGNLSMQLGFLWKELSESYKGVLTTLKNATSVEEASNAVLLQYERPANTGASVQNTRAGYGKKYYDKYAGATTTTAAPSTSGKVTAKKAATSFLKSLAGTYKCTGNLNMRDGAGTDNAILTTLPKGTKVQNYGYYTNVKGVKWLYVQVTYKNVVYTGFCSVEYLSKC
ncbi:MAG: phage tail tip lysozyme [Lachnospiraceae bacterium]|nr:phage tail tip lysozyme [Lachnospiraceae bacterium]